MLAHLSTTPCNMLALLSTLPATAAALSLRFSQPTPLPAGKGPFYDSLRAVTKGDAIAWTASGYYATHDGGKSWLEPKGVVVGPLRASDPVWQNDTEFAILSTNGTLHNMGDSVQQVAAAAARGVNVTAVSTNVTTKVWLDGEGQFRAATAAANISFSGLPAPGIVAFRTGGADWVRLPDGKTLVAAIIVTWAGTGRQGSIVAFRSTDGGFAWAFAGDIAHAGKVVSNEGPNENSLALLSNGSLLCVMRLDAGDAGRYHHYATSVSVDGGHSWSAPRMNYAVGSCRPRLLRLGAGLSGPLLLSGGRTWNHNRDTFLWLNEAGDGAAWLPHSISYWHNALAANGTKRFDPVATNDSNRWPRESNSYTSLVATGPSSGLVTYDLGGAGFAMRFELIQYRSDPSASPSGTAVR